MKPISIMIDSFESIDELRNLSKRTDSLEVLEVLLEIYKESGYAAACESLTQYPIGVDAMPHLTTKQVRTLDGWLDVLTCKPVHGMSHWACTFSHNPDLVYLLDKNGFSPNFRIFQIRDVKKPKKVKKDSNVPTKTPEPDYLEPAFPL